MNEKGSKGAARGYLFAVACVLCPIWLTALIRVAMWVGGVPAISAEAAGVATACGIVLGLFGAAVYGILRYAP